jgi:hypothetical protein
MKTREFRFDRPSQSGDENTNNMIECLGDEDNVGAYNINGFQAGVESRPCDAVSAHVISKTSVEALTTVIWYCDPK